MAPERLPRGWAQEAHHLAVAPRLSQVVRRLAWDAAAAFWRGNSEKACGCGQINQDKSFSQVKNNTHGICHAEFSISGQIWQINAHGFDLKDPICFHVSRRGRGRRGSCSCHRETKRIVMGSDMFPFFKLWTYLQQIKKSLHSTNSPSFLTGCLCS